jgi:RNA polymerase subunit RPABC4/transcription elongation factor Spt4
MALIYCRGCGKQINEQAYNCPNCGAPNPLQHKRKRFITVLVIILIAVVCIAVYQHLHPTVYSKPASKNIEARVEFG